MFLTFWFEHMQVSPESKTMNFASKDLAIITFYAAQRTQLKDSVKKYKDIQVLSVDQSQGREYELVLMSTVRTTEGRFISDYQRINVALTRAQHGLVIFGHQKTLKKDEMWSYMLDYHKARVFKDV